MSAKTDLINKICEDFSKHCDLEMTTILNMISVAMEGYEVTKTSTEIVPYTGDINVQLIKKFIVVKKIAGCTPKTLLNYKQGLMAQIPKLKKSVLEVTTDDIREWLARLEIQEGVGPAGRDGYRRILSSFFTWLHDDAMIARNPMKGIPKIKKPLTKKKAFTDLEIEKMRRACRNCRDEFVIEGLLSTGARADEFINIRRDEVEGNRILVHGKGQKDRYVYLNAKAQLALEEYMKDRKDMNPYLFPASIWKGELLGGLEYQKNQKHGRHFELWKHPEYIHASDAIGRDYIAAIINRVAKRAGVEHAHPHKFRRTCATNALKRGMPIEQVSLMLGHCDLKTTQIYLDIDESDLKRAHDKYVV